MISRRWSPQSNDLESPWISSEVQGDFLFGPSVSRSRRTQSPKEAEMDESGACPDRGDRPRRGRDSRQAQQLCVRLGTGAACWRSNWSVDQPAQRGLEFSRIPNRPSASPDRAHWRGPTQGRSGRARACPRTTWNAKWAWGTRRMRPRVQSRFPPSRSWLSLLAQPTGLLAPPAA